MLRKLLIIALVLSTSYVFAQKKHTAKKSAAKAVATVPAKVDTTDYRALGSPLPPIRIVTSSGRNITNKDVNNDANLFVMLFNPSCGHCIDETTLLRDNIFLFKKTHILLVASAIMGPYVETFEKDLKLSEFPSIWVGLDSNNLVDKTFTYQGMPQIDIYDKNRKLIKRFISNTPIDSLKQYIQ